METVPPVAKRRSLSSAVCASGGGLGEHVGSTARSSAGRSWALVLLPVRPQILDRIQFRRIAGKKLHPQASPLLADELPGGAAAMTRQPVPDDQQLAGNVPQ